PSFSFHCSASPPDLHSFPTRRSSDLLVEQSHRALDVAVAEVALLGDHEQRLRALADRPRAAQSNAHEALARFLVGGRARHASALDRKSTRLNSSHSQISYAVFCLKKK